MLIERIYHIKHNLSEIPKCSYCGNELNFIRRAGSLCYTAFCSRPICKCTHIRKCGTGKKQSKETRAKRSKALKGRIFSDVTKKKISIGLKKYHQTEEGKKAHLRRVRNPISRTKQSHTLKEKIRRGDFTPCVTNSWTNRKHISINNQKYRSTWDAAFHILNPNCKYEKIRIPYTSNKKTQHNYIVDFVDEQKKILYEIKPECNINKEENLIKFRAARKWCEQNDYIFKIITNDWFENNAQNINYKKYNLIIKKGMEQFL